MKRIAIPAMIAVMSLLLLIPAVRGKGGWPPYYQRPQERKTEVGGPFELSNSTSRYALTTAIASGRTFFLDEKSARFAAPDVVDYQGKFISIFTPGISFLGVPLYLMGEKFGVAQLSTYSLNIILSLINILLISRLARVLGAGGLLSYAGGLVFVFGTNTLVYAQSFTQHMASAAVVVAMLINALGGRNWKSNMALGALVGMGALFDIPNLLLAIPILLFVAAKSIPVEKTQKTVRVRINMSIILILVGLLPFLAVFAWYNWQTTGSFTRIAQNIGRTHFFRDQVARQNPVDVAEELVSTPKEDRAFEVPFDSRHLLRGLWIFLVSNERSWLWYSPVIMVGFLGLAQLVREPRSASYGALLATVVFLNIVLYSMFGDPWGGWAFGPRYLIPAAAVLAASVTVALRRFGKKLLFQLLFTVLLGYSVFVSTLGAITTTAVPPKVEAVNLARPIPYTYELNLKMLLSGSVSSLLYDSLVRRIATPWVFWCGYSSLIVGTVVTLTWLGLRQAKGEKQL